jgi:hypothetical protein
MAITFRYDAAGVVPPSNESTRKYGQSLVLQQQQQKYAGQQAGYDRMFQWGRDNQQNAFQMGRDQRQNDFLIGRDKTQFDQQQQQAEAERQRKFMDDARKQSSGFIMDSIKNGEYDPATARKLQQNLVAESEALGNPNLDATQRAEALAKIRAERAMLSANRMEAPPKPTPQQQFDQGIVVGPDGMKYRANSKGDFEPLPVQPTQPAPPATAIDAFRADPKLQKQYIEDAVNVLTEGGMKPLTPAMRKQASALARELYDSDYGGSQSAPGQPTPGQPQQQTPSTSSLPFSGLRNAIGNVAGIAGQILSPPEQTQGSRAVATVDRADGRATYLNPDGTTTLGPVPEGPVESRPVAAVDRADGRATYINPDGTTSLGPVPPPGNSPSQVLLEDTASSQPQNPWAEVAAPQRSQMPLTANSTSRNPAGQPMAAKQPSQSVPAAPKQSTITAASPEAFEGLRQKFTKDKSTQDELHSLEEKIRGSEAPEVQQAGLVIMQMLDVYGGKPPAQGSEDFNRLREAMRVITAAGIDLASSTTNAKYRDRASAIKSANDESRKRNGSKFAMLPGEM